MDDLLYDLRKRWILSEEFTQSDFEKADEIEDKLISLAQKAKNAIDKAGGDKLNIHNSNVDIRKLNSAIPDIIESAEQEVSMKPEGFWQAKGSSWFDIIISHFHTWLAPNIYVVIGGNPLIAEENWEEVELFDAGDGTWAWDELKDEFPDYDGFEVRSQELITKKFPTWEVPSGVIWTNNGGVKLKELDVFTEEEKAFISQYGSDRIN